MEKLDELRFCIGGITFSVRASGYDLRHDHNRLRYQPFLVLAEPDVFVQRHFEPFALPQQQLKIYDPFPDWNISKLDASYLFHIGDEMALFREDFTQADIYSDKDVVGPGFSSFDYPFDQFMTIGLLSQRQGILVHACGVSDCGHGLLFAGVSGAGKSTIANLWKDKKDATVFSDDRVVIRKIDGRFWMYGTPWHGDAELCSPEKVLLERIFFLNHARENKVEGIKGVDAASKLLVCSFPTFWDKKGMESTLGFIDELVREVPCYRFNFLPDKRIIDFVRNI
jgi:hypothetical protein